MKNPLLRNPLLKSLSPRSLLPKMAKMTKKNPLADSVLCLSITLMQSLKQNAMQKCLNKSAAVRFNS